MTLNFISAQENVMYKYTNIRTKKSVFHVKVRYLDVFQCKLHLTNKKDQFMLQYQLQTTKY